LKKCETYKSRLERFRSSSEIGDGDCWPEEEEEDDDDDEEEQQDSAADEDDDDDDVVVNEFSIKSREVSSGDGGIFVADAKECSVDDNALPLSIDDLSLVVRYDDEQ